jgi:hypothetical protein
MTTEQLVHSLAQQVANLTASLQSKNSAKTSMTKPEVFKGQDSTEARRFLAHFISWAWEQPDLNGNEPRCIKAALGLFSGTAANWATPYIIAFNANNIPFNGKWDDFVAAFRLRFESIEPEMEAEEAIKHLQQGKNQKVAEYAQVFKDVGSRTGLSDRDLLSRFYGGLHKEIRKNIVVTNIAQGVAKTLDEAIKRAIAVDTYLRDPSMNDQHSSRSLAPANPAPDPYAMDISAAQTSNGKTRDDFLARMRRRCYGCGSQSHEKKNCPHRETTCRYCSRKGHLEAVCQDKFTGAERGRGLKKQTNRRQQISATSEAPFSLFPDEQVQVAASSSTPGPSAVLAPPVADLTAQIAQLQALLNRANAMTGSEDFL